MTRPHLAAPPRRSPVHLAILVLVLVVALAGVARPASADPQVDDWGRDPDVLSGSIEEICGDGPGHDSAAARPGRVAIMDWLAETFPETSGLSGFTCREIHNPRTSCQGRRAPAESDCWSTHAAGRAIDVFVGGAGDQDGTPVGKELGDRIANLLLATVDGIPNYRARVMGVQQLLWDGRCWSARQHADAGVTDINDLDGDCVDLHDDHVHITLSEAGADGLTSFHTGEVFLGGSDEGQGDGPVDLPAGDPRDAHLLAWNAEDGRLLLRGVAEDATFTDEEASEELETGWTAVATPDVGGNGNDELFAYDKVDGRHLLREIRSDGSLGSELPGETTLDPGWSLVATPDVDGDGDDELLLYRGDDGSWALHELREDGDLGPALAVADVPLDVFFSNAATPDVDGDGDDELLLYRRFDGHHVVLDFADAEALAAVEEADEAEDTDEDEDADEGEDGVDDDADPTLVDLDTDADDDGLANVTVAIAPLAPILVDEDGLPVDAEVLPESDEESSDADESSEQPEADAAETPALGGPLTAGFTTLTAVDVDADGIDELALYREGDGCLAVRELQRPVVVVDEVVEDTEDAGDEAAILAGEQVQPCLTTADRQPEAAGEDADDEDEAAGDGRELDPETWLLESRDALAPGWTSLVGAAVD
ncbi:FG-GAP repeat domain-containing protein [Salsipaludibacter albus]|uniref:FG-GAP repeat domain-containing protein n=1 Tax=Salsipaludibacter albus TaxID=2849650 RepID=UPI001EE4DA63|nr:VCBS repeat-containing protein [Salsipaludibacter albus]MBY5163371.1 VCBS repeat-containing protein [Salsipaludibacter albus]